MKSLSAFPVALLLALSSGAIVAQDRPNTTLVQKSKAKAAASAKAAKSATQSPAALSGVKHGSPTTSRSAPGSERAYDGCQGKELDA